MQNCTKTGELASVVLCKLSEDEYRAYSSPGLFPSSLAIVSEREKQLWDRQDALLARWDVERAANTARETTLLQQLSRLQDALILLATSSADRRSTSDLSERNQRPAESSEPRASGSRPSSPPPRSVLNEAAAFMPDNLSSKPSTAEASPSLNVSLRRSVRTVTAPCACSTTCTCREAEGLRTQLLTVWESSCKPHSILRAQRTSLKLTSVSAI